MSKKMNEDTKKKINEAANLYDRFHMYADLTAAYKSGTEFMLSLVLEILESEEAKKMHDVGEYGPKNWGKYLRTRFGVKDV